MNQSLILEQSRRTALPERKHLSEADENVEQKNRVTVDATVTLLELS